MKYKYLKEDKILKFDQHKKFFLNVRIFFRWFSYFISIFIIFLIGLIFFYKRLDDKIINIDSLTYPENQIFSNVSVSEKDEKPIIDFDNQDKKNDLKTVSEPKDKLVSVFEEPKNTVLNEPNKNKTKFNFEKWNKKAPIELKIVNKHNSLENYVPELKKVAGIDVNVVMAKSLLKMIEAARKDNINLEIISGYRTLERQKKILENQIKIEEEKIAKSKDKIKSNLTNDAKTQALKVVARPGQSEHNLGIAVDLGKIDKTFKKTSDYDWLCVNAKKFGFIQRYSENKEGITEFQCEPWHWRYIGEEHASKIGNLSLEEYISSIEPIAG